MTVFEVAEQARAVSQIYEYSLRAVGDVTFTTVTVIASCWLCGVGAELSVEYSLRAGACGLLDSRFIG